MTCTRTLAVLTLLALGDAIAVEAQERRDQNALRVSLPGKSWELQVDARGFTIKTNESKPGGQRYLLAENSSTGVTLSISLTPVEGEARIEDCWKVFRERIKNSKIKVTGVKESQVGDMAISEFVFPEVNGIPIQQKNVFGCLAKDNVYADLHLSKVEFKAGDQSLFTSILNGVHVTDQNAASEPQRSQPSTYYWGEGSTYFKNGQYDKAIVPYRKALDLERTDRKLDEKLWRVLIDNLAMAYGITGDLKSAEEVLQYGISKDPTYPLFYYNMACVSAERNDLDNTMKYLTTAFGYQQNIIPGESMPDPRKDDSFQRFLQDEKFRKLIDSLK